MDKFANREVVNAVLLDYATKKPFHYMDYANASSNDMTANRVFATGGWGAPNLVTFDGERGGTFKIDTQILPMELFAMLAGDDIKTVASVLKREVLTATGSGSVTVSLSEAPVENSVYVYAEDDDCGSVVASTVSDKTVTLTSGTANAKYIVYYYTSKDSGVKKVTFNSKKFPKCFIFEGETIWKGTDGITYPMFIKGYKLCPQVAFSLSLSNTGDPTTLSITFDVLADDDGNQLDMTLITE